MKPAPFDYVRASSVEEAVAALAASNGDAKVLAGGQSLVPMLNFRVVDAPLFVDINGIEGLDRIEEKEDGGNSCLIIDDFSEELKDLKLEKHLKKLIHKHRHYRINIIISLLTLKSLPKSLRSLIDVYILFKPKSLIEVETMSDEIFGLSKKDLLTLFEYVFDEPHTFLFYNQRLNKFYKNFNKLRLKK